jgi:hypothetical protein
MARIKKYSPSLSTNLTYYETFVVDTNPNSDYFKITEFKDTFTGGKNGFLIEGSEHLMESTEIKVEIIDVNGNPIYYEPGNGVPEYYEGLSKVIAVYVYEDTPIGDAKITVLGELKSYKDGVNVKDIPDNWKGVYNVKWEKSFKVNRLLPNEDTVRFYKRPNVNITEITKPIFSTALSTITQTGSLSGTPITPEEGQPLVNYKLPTFYKLKIDDNTNWTGSIANTYIQIPELAYSGLVDNVINNKELLVKNPYTLDGYVAPFSNLGYTASFSYFEGIGLTASALTGSFAKINISDLTTFVGDVSRVKIFRKSQSQVVDYQFIQEIALESNELLIDLESKTKNQEYYGEFTQPIIQDYWVTSSNSISATFNQNYLYDSVKLNSPTSQFFYTSKSIAIKEGSEYSLDFNIRLKDTVSSQNYVRAFLSGSRESMVNGNPITIQIEQPITTIVSNNGLIQKSNSLNNIKAEQIDNARLYFEIVGNNWHIANVSFKASKETAFSPDDITFIQSVPRELPVETFDYRFEFYGSNNKLIPVLVEEQKTFNGGNLQNLKKELKLIPSSLYFQFDSGSNPVPPTVININVQKTLLTGSVNFTSQSIDFYGDVLKYDDYTASFTGQQYPGLLGNINSDNPFLTVQNFTGSRTDKLVQYLEITGETEGYKDTIVISRVLDGFGGVNHIIRPFRGLEIRNSSTQSLEIQAVRIDGVNDIPLSSTTQPNKGWSRIQLHVISSSLEGVQKFVNLAYASSSGFIKGLTTGSLGTREINYNATFNRDSIDKRLTVYLMPSSSNPLSSSVLASTILSDFQDGLDSGFVSYTADAFTINPRIQTTFTPTSASATASFFIRGTNENPVSGSLTIFPSMSINVDYVPEYWMYYVTHSFDPHVTVIAIDDNKNIIPSRTSNQFVGLPLSQSKTLTVTWTYTEDYTSASVSIDKTFSIIPEGKPGDESIVFETNPLNVALKADAKGIVNSYDSSATEIKLKQGSRYLVFTGSRDAGTFHIATASIVTQNIVAGKVEFNQTSSLFVSKSSALTQLSGSVEYPLIIHPYYTSSIYTASIVQNYTKILDGAPPLDVTIEPIVVSLNSDEVGAIYDYSRTSTTIRIKEGSDYLVYSDVSTAPGTFRVDGIDSTHITNLAISGSSTTTASLKFNGFHYPYVSASAVYNIVAYPYSLGPGHIYSSSAFQRTQLFTKNVAPAKARTVSVSAISQTITYDRDTNDFSPQGDNTLTATAFNTTGSVYYYWFDGDGNEIGTDPTHLDNTHNPGDSTGNPGPGEVYTYIVKITDGNPYTSPTINPYRAEASVSVSGVKQGADAYKLVATNENTSITADLWTTQFTGSGIRISAFKGTDELIHTSSYSNATKVYDYLGTFIGNVGYYSASIHSKSNYITPAGSVFPPSRPASIGDITGWTNPGTNKSGNVIYKVDFENGRQTQFVTQSIGVQFTPPAPYDAKLTNENASIVYKVSGEVEFIGTGTLIRAYRGDTILTNKPSGFTGGQSDAYGNTGYKEQCRITIFDKSSHITLAGSLVPGNAVPGTSTSASLGTNPDWIGVTAWNSPETNPTAVIIYEIDCEGRQKLYKTQSLSVQFEGNTGPGVVMRGEWSAGTDYIGSVETTNYRRDAVIYNAIPGTTTYYAAVSGSGPGTATGAHAPSGTTSDTPYWQYLGTEDFFVSAKIAIFEESYVKNTINVGTKNGTGAFANIVIAGGRTDPYIAIGQNATVGTAGTSGTSTSPTGVIGYDRPGIFLGIYESSTSGGGAGTTGRFSISNADGTKALKWDGSTLTIVGALRQVTPGVSEGSLRGTWTTGFTYYANDIVSYAGQSWQCTSGASHVATNDTNGTTGYPGSGPWVVAAAAGTSGTGGSSGTAGPAGSPGAGVVYRGVWADGVTYYKTTERTDIVKGSDNQYYICKSTYTPSGTSTRPVDGGSYTTYWQSFGATFSSVATDVLLAQDATITRGLVLGTEGSFAGFLRSANATTLQSGVGFFLDVNGNFRFGESVAPGNNYVYWNGTQLDISGKITATEGNIGGFTIANNVLAASGSLLQIDTQIPQISFFRKGDLSSAKVVLNPSQYLSNPAADPLYGDSGAQWTGTTSVSAAAGTTSGVDTYVTTDGISVKGTTTDYLGTTTALAAGAIDVTVYVPTTTLTQTAGGITTTSAYPSHDPRYAYDSYSSTYAGARSSNAIWYIQLYDATGTTLITEQQLPNASTYRSGPSSYQYYYAYSYTGYEPYYWNGPNTISSAGYYQGDITAGTRTTTVNIPAAAVYKVALCLRVNTGAGFISDYTTYTSTYYANTGTASHGSTGALTTYSDIRFKTNVNKTEISGGGVQVVTNESSYVRMLRVDPGAYTYSSLLFQVNGGRADITPGGASLAAIWGNDALTIWGCQYIVGNLRIGGGTGTISSTAYEVLKVDGQYTSTIANQWYATFVANINPYADDTFDLGKASSGRWRDIFTNGAVTTTSDRTKKTNITPSTLGLDFINKLTPVSYTMITGSKVWEELPPTIQILEEEEEYDNGYLIKEAKYKEIPNPQVPEIIEILPGKRTHYGLIAQDVKVVLDEMGLSTTDFAGYMAADPIEHTDLGLRYEEFISPIVKAIQELSSKVDRLEAEISSSKI